MDEEDNPWVELANNGITREDQIEDYKNWIARRQAALDQHKKQFDQQYDHVRPHHNRHRLEDLEAWQFRIDLDKWQLDQFISGLDEEPPQTEGDFEC